MAVGSGKMLFAHPRPTVCYDIVACLWMARNCSDCSNRQGSCGQYREYFSQQSFLVEVDPLGGGYENVGAAGWQPCYRWKTCQNLGRPCPEDEELDDCGGVIGEFTNVYTPDWWVLTDPC